jgi:hypothetical protein
MSVFKKRNKNKIILIFSCFCFVYIVNIPFGNVQSIQESNSNNNQQNATSIQVAIIALIGTILSVTLTTALGIRSHTKQKEINDHMEDIRKETEKELEVLRSKLVKEKDEQAALRDYQYDVKKRLYQEFEPLLFLLVEYSESSRLRIRNFVKMAKKGKLNTKDGLANYGVGDYTISTIYRLLLPIVIFKLMQRTLTIFDLDLVPVYKVHYEFAKFLHLSFRSDFYLSEDSKPPLVYKPIYPDFKKCEIFPMMDSQHKMQGIDLGIIDNMVEALITNDLNGNPKIMSYGEFIRTYFEPNVKEPFKQIAYLFHNFHPKTSPVLWRILIAQAYIYHALIDIRKTENYKAITDFKKLKTISNEDRKKHYDWRQKDENVSEEEVLRQPFDAVEYYFKNESNLKDYLNLDVKSNEQ